MTWETVIGLEIHAQLATKSKIFSGSATAFGAEPNTQANLVDLGYPGVLPVLNGAAVRMAVKFGLAIGANVARRSVFARKNYFYPDLPKGYQISQFELPIVEQGKMEIVLEDGSTKVVGITRAHLEEDAGKSLHEDFHGFTGIDLNRAGTPLIEIVSEPDMRSAKEAVAYMKKIHTLVRYLEICDGNMQEGSFRCDANVSVRRKGEEKYGTRCEIKNLNSFRFIEKAINYEVARQIDLIESGGKVVQQTRLYDPDKGETRALRSKEEANDYRYFPDPDLLPVVLDDAYVDSVRATLPELPDEKAARLINDFDLPAYDAGVLTASREMAEFYEGVLSALSSKQADLPDVLKSSVMIGTSVGASLADQTETMTASMSFGSPPVVNQGNPVDGAGGGGHFQIIVPKQDAKLAANVVINMVTSSLNSEGLDIAESKVSAAQLAGLLTRINDSTLSGKLAKEVFEVMWAEGKTADEIIEAKGLKQITDTGAIEKVIDEVIAANPKQLADYRSGKDKLFGFFVGQVMKLTAGKANPAQVNDLLKRKLAG